jgi:hypothetical protein
MNDQTEETQALERFLDDLILDPNTPAPITGDLDPETAASARRIVQAEQGQMPSPREESSAQARVWERVLAQAHPASANASEPGNSKRRSFAWLGMRVPFGRAKTDAS